MTRLVEHAASQHARINALIGELSAADVLTPPDAVERIAAAAETGEATHLRELKRADNVENFLSE